MTFAKQNGHMANKTGNAYISELGTTWLKFQRKTLVFRPLKSRLKYVQETARTIDNWKWQHGVYKLRSHNGATCTGPKSKVSILLEKFRLVLDGYIK